jgi:argininosuccinate synthase
MKNVKKYQKIASHEAHKGTFQKCLLLYSGGLDTSVMLKWIQEEYKCQVVALTLDIGQTADDLEAIKKKALNLGATEAIVYDAKEQFANEQLSMAIKANADYQGGYALSTPLGRVVISEIAVDMAEQYDCQVIAHGCTGKGNDQVRFESYITTLNPSLKVIAPVREWGMGRKEEIEYAEEHNIPVKQKADSPYSYDENMWGNTAEGGEIEDPFLEPKTNKILQWCKPIEDSPDQAETVNITFDKGIPTSLDGVEMKLSQIIAKCNEVGAKYGVGVVQLIEDRLIGLKVRGIYENPGASILINAHKKLEQLVSTRQENEFKSLIDTKWAYLLYAAQWFEPTMKHLHSYIDSQNQKVCGNVTVRLYKGTITVVSLTSPYSLFDHNLATFEKNSAFNQNASAGFIEIYNLPQKSAYGVFNYDKN